MLWLPSLPADSDILKQAFGTGHQHHALLCLQSRIVAIAVDPQAQGLCCLPDCCPWHRLVEKAVMLLPPATTATHHGLVNLIAVSWHRTAQSSRTAVNNGKQHKSASLGLLDCRLVHQPSSIAALFCFKCCLHGPVPLETAYESEECCCQGWLMHQVTVKQTQSTTMTHRLIMVSSINVGNTDFCYDTCMTKICHGLAGSFE